MQFDVKIVQAGIAVLTALCSVAAAYFTLKADIRVHEEKITRMESMIQSMQNQQNSTYEALYEIKRDMAVIRYQIEKGVKP